LQCKTAIDWALENYSTNNKNGTRADIIRPYDFNKSNFLTINSHYTALGIKKLWGQGAKSLAGSGSARGFNV